LSPAGALTVAPALRRPYVGDVLILAIIAFGIIAGGLAQMILGRSMREVHWGQAVAAGLAGSFVGGLLVSLAAGDGLELRPSGLLGSLAGAVLLTWLWSLRTARAS
jgi:uncharacterized membrane protein YeaQ/YmgE (transglycosylase-associated protein family)